MNSPYLALDIFNDGVNNDLVFNPFSVETGINMT